MTRRRERHEALPAVVYTGYTRQKPYNKEDWGPQTALYVAPPSWYNRSWSQVEACVDEIHPGPPYRTGGPFDHYKATDPCLPLQGYGVYQAKDSYGNIYEYDGAFFPSGAGPIANLGTLKPCTDTIWKSYGAGDISSYGATGWARYQPIKPTVDIGQSVYEIKQTIPMLRTTAKGLSELFNSYRSFASYSIKSSAKKAADQWLNTQFGWKPLISDIMKLLSLQEKLEKQYQHLVRYNGKWHKRGGIVNNLEPATVTTRTTSTCFYTGGLNGTLTQPGYAGQWTNTATNTRQQVWFEGRFRYYIPEMELSTWRTDYFKRLGLGITPTLIYDLTPWSWLIDWFTNLGDVVENIGTAGQSVAKYAYIMGHTQVVKTVDTCLPIGGKVAQGHYEFALERKQRVAANPFGFGLQWFSLSPLQWSILGALGIGRIH